jgi:hypothetical protein
MEAQLVAQAAKVTFGIIMLQPIQHTETFQQDIVLLPVIVEPVQTNRLVLTARVETTRLERCVTALSGI